jgi:hypothetical protein
MIGSFRAMNSLLFFAGFEIVATRLTQQAQRENWHGFAVITINVS